MRKILRYYQTGGVRFALSVSHPALWWKMRLGKTLTCIRACLKYSNCRLFLVVGPFSIFPAWIEELENEKQKNVVILDGTRTKRLEKLKNLPSTGNVWCILNKEGYAVVPEVAGMAWDVVILDESIFVANPASKVTKFFCSHFRTAKHRWALCGTPAPENALQYFMQVKWLDASLFVEKSYWAFRHKYCNLVGMGDYNITAEGQKYLTHVLSHCSTFIDRSDVKMGGVIVREQRPVVLPATIRKHYAQLEKEFYLEIDGTGHETIFAGQKYVWLRKLCGGFNEEIGVVSFHKCSALVELLQGELKGESAVVWCEYLEEIAQVSQYLTDHKIKNEKIHGSVSVSTREKYRQQFQSGKVRVLVILTATMSYSAKLTAASALIYFSSPVSAKIREQSENRHIDVSVTDNALVIDMPCLDTIEEDILLTHIKKESRSESIVRLAKSIQRRNK